MLSEKHGMARPCLGRDEPRRLCVNRGAWGHRDAVCARVCEGRSTRAARFLKSTRFMMTMTPQDEMTTTPQDERRPDPPDRPGDNEQPRDDEAPATPPTEPEPVPVQDPPDAPGQKRGPYVA